MADVSKALQSLRALVRTGRGPVFGGGDNGEQHYIMNRETGETNMVRDDGLNYLVRLYVVSKSQQLFAGQVWVR